MAHLFDLWPVHLSCRKYARPLALQFIALEDIKSVHAYGISLQARRLSVGVFGDADFGSHVMIELLCMAFGQF